MKRKLLLAMMFSLLCTCFSVPAAHAGEDGYLELESPYVTKIEIVQPADRTEYDLGEIFDPAGLILQATCSDGSVRDVEDFSFPDSPLTMRSKKVTISYGAFSVDQEVRVEDPNADPATICILQFSGTFVLRLDLFKDQHFRIYFDGFNGDQSSGSWSWQDGKLTLHHGDQGLMSDYHGKVEIIEPDETGTMSYSFFHEKTGYQTVTADATAWMAAFGEQEFPMKEPME